MRTIERISQFKRDYKREAKGRYRDVLNVDFACTVSALANDEQLPDQQHDHALAGEWKDHRDGHVRPDLVLIYRKTGDDVLQLVRIGSHSQLSL